jgi:hypothetical protein
MTIELETIDEPVLPHKRYWVVPYDYGNGWWAVWDAHLSLAVNPVGGHFHAYKRRARSHARTLNKIDCQVRNQRGVV